MENDLDSDIKSIQDRRAIFARSLDANRPGEFSSRRMALQIELAVGLTHFAQETTDPTGKSALKAIYHAAGYECMAKVDRDYKTVNRRLNITAKLFEILGSDTIKQWCRGSDGTEAMISRVAIGLATYCFESLDDVADFVGVDSNRTRVKCQSANSQSLEDIQAQLLAQYDDDLLCHFATDLLKAVAERRQLKMS